MANKHFSSLDPVSQSNNDYFIATRDNGDGTFTDVRISAETKKTITVTETSNTLSDSFFSDKNIYKIYSNGQVYIRDVQFEQVEDVVSLTNGDTFILGQKILAEI